jgi:hypothetical protein
MDRATKDAGHIPPIWLWNNLVTRLVEDLLMFVANRDDLRHWGGHLNQVGGGRDRFRVSCLHKTGDKIIYPSCRRRGIGLQRLERVDVSAAVSMIRTARLMTSVHPMRQNRRARRDWRALYGPLVS